MAVGLIFEANPYHYGHRYLINEVKNLFPDHELIMVTSTSWTMRGEFSLIDKFSKINIYLQENIDLIFELPFTATLQSADFFAYNAIKILTNLQVEHLVVGCEETDISIFEKIYLLIKSNQFQKNLNSKNFQNLSYKQKFTIILSNLGISPQTIELFNQPNFTLAFQYYSVIKDHNFPIKLTLIKRTNSYYQTEIDHNDIIVSSSFIRNCVQNRQDFSSFLPYDVIKIDFTAFQNNLSLILNYQTLLKNVDNINDKEGIKNYINKRIPCKCDFNTLITSLGNKKYSYSRIRRFIIKELLQANNYPSKIDTYLRLLGLNEKGEKYLQTLPKEAKQLIFSTPKNAKNLSFTINNILAYELNATKLYSFLSQNFDLIIQEYQLPIKKEGN